MVFGSDLTFGCLVRALVHLRQARPRRKRSQGLIEYAAITAAVALVGVAGLSAITQAQKGYFEGLPLTPAAPSAPGALLHPTRVDPPDCLPNPVALSTTLTCSAPRVYDVFSNASDRNPPWGVLVLRLDGDATSYASCTLPRIATGDQNTCSGPVTWTPSNPAWAATTRMLFWSYESPASNHVPSTSPGASIGFLPLLQFNPAPYCSVEGQPTTNSVAYGWPITCVANVVDVSASGAPAPNVPVTFEVMPGASGNGSPTLTCATGEYSSAGLRSHNISSILLSTIYSTGGACTPSSTLTCATSDGSSAYLPPIGECHVIYRRLRSAGLATAIGPGYDDIQVGLPGLPPVHIGGAGHSVNVQTLTTPNPAQSWMNCSAPPGNVTVTTDTGYAINVGYGTFSTTTGIRVSGRTGQVNCQPVVADVSESTATVCVNSPPDCQTDPDRHHAFSPVGQIYWLWDGNSMSVPGPCELRTLSPFSTQAPSGTPFASDCGALIRISLSGNPGETHQLTAVYAGFAPNPTHSTPETGGGGLPTKTVTVTFT